MSKSVVVLASGRTEQRALPNLLGNLKDEGILVDIRIPPRNGAITAELAVRIAKGCVFDDPPPDKFVVLVDVDRNDPEEVLEPLRSGIGGALDHPDLKVYYAYAQQHLEAWFFADERGLRRYLGRNLGSPDASRPDLIDNPKLHLKHILGGRFYTSEVAERISESLDAAMIEARSTSFSRFVDAVRNGGGAE